jgi:hypothetical protein
MRLDVKALSVYIKCEGLMAYPMPCAICRQNLVEFGFFPIFCVKSPYNFMVKTLSSLLPFALRAFSSQAHVFAPSPKKIGDVIDAAHYWVQMDPNPVTRNEVERIICDDNFDEMKKMFCKRIDFGTAGLRGRMGAGYSQMNDLVVQQTAQGISKFVIEEFGSEACKERGIIIGYDGRHNSKAYAHITAAVFSYFGIKPLLMDDLVATPLVPYSIVRLKALCGIMVTASHNPKEDNGYKVYWENGAQIIEPHDRLIREHIMRNLDLMDLIEFYDYWKREVKFGLEALREKMLALYLEEVQKKCMRNPIELNRACKPITYTAMHGVGHHMIQRVFKLFGIDNVHDGIL